MSKSAPKLEFQVADGWPHRKAAVDARASAVQSLVANHTLIVGQSRSGKSNAARRLIEEILVWTETRVVILDPNADFRLLKTVKSGDREFRKHWQPIRDQVVVASPDENAWGILWSKLSFEEMAAFLRFTPKETFSEYRHLDRHVKYMKYQDPSTSLKGTLEEFSKSSYFDVAAGEDMEQYRLLLNELSRKRVWATDKTGKDLDTLLAGAQRAMVVNLAIDDEEARTITAARTLEVLWRDGEEKRKKFLNGSTDPWSGTLVVIDEAHLFAPPSTEDPQKRAVCERIERLADQGKKLNLFLMVITQQPSKLHKGVLSECNNRIILRVNERLSLRVLEETYGGIRGRYDGALTFNPGEALLEGALLCDETPPPPTPRGVRFTMARTQEGGGTPKANWAIPKAV